MPREQYILPAVNDLQTLQFELQRILDSIALRLNYMDADGDDVTFNGKKITNLDVGVSDSDAVRKDQIFLLDSLADIILGATNRIEVIDNNNGTITLTIPNSYLSGTADQITVTNNANGTTTLSFPSSIIVTDYVRSGKIWHAYGGFQDEAETITIATVDTWTTITNATTDLWVVSESDGISITNDIMTITNAGDYAGILSMSFSGLTDKDFQMRLYNITQSLQMGYTIGASTAGAGNFTNVSVPLYIEADAGDTLRMEVQCITDSSDPTFKNAIFHLNYLHE